MDEVHDEGSEQGLRQGILGSCQPQSYWQAPLQQGMKLRAAALVFRLGGQLGICACSTKFNAYVKSDIWSQS